MLQMKGLQTSQWSPFGICRNCSILDLGSIYLEPRVMIDWLSKIGWMRQ